MMDLDGAVAENGRNVHTWSAWDTNAQKWKLTEYSSGNTVLSAHTNKGYSRLVVGEAHQPAGSKPTVISTSAGVVRHYLDQGGEFNWGSNSGWKFEVTGTDNVIKMKWPQVGIFKQPDGSWKPVGCILTYFRNSNTLN